MGQGRLPVAQLGAWLSQRIPCSARRMAVERLWPPPRVPPPPGGCGRAALFPPLDVTATAATAHQTAVAVAADVKEPHPDPPTAPAAAATCWASAVALVACGRTQNGGRTGSGRGGGGEGGSKCVGGGVRRRDGHWCGL